MRCFSFLTAAGFSCLVLLGSGLDIRGATSAGGLQFDGVDDYVTFGQAPGLGAATFTLETWFKRTGTGVTTTSGSGGVTAVPLIAKGRGEGDGANVDMNYFLGIRTTDNILVADFEEGATGTTPGLNHPVAGGTVIAMNTWYHTAATYDGTRWQLYLNGVLETELVVGQPPRGDSIQHASLGSALTSVGTPAGYFAGVLDEVRIWNYARAGADILANKDASISSAPGLLGSWHLDEAGGITAADSSGNAIAGTLVNGPVWVNAPAPQPPVTYVATGSIWKYLDNGSDAGTAWRAPAFDDSAWASGPAELGYGDGGEATVVSYGGNTSKKYITTYFRHSFTVQDAAAVESLTMRLLRDDGAVIYLNGVEAARQNMPSGTVTYTTVASAAVGGADETTYFEGSLSPALLVEGNNVLALELHQNAADSSDISFNLELTAVRRTMTLALESPLADAVDVSRPPVLRASAAHRSGTPMTAVVYGRIAPPPGGPDFTIAALPDTQFYTTNMNGGTLAMFQSQANWIVNNRDAWNIVYVAHEGDLSNDGDKDPAQWLNAINVLYRLEPALPEFPDGVPYGIAVGNHEQVVPTGDTEPTTYYNQYFGVAHFQERSYYGGHYGANNNNHYALFSASGLDFIVIFFEYTATGPSQAVLAWANGLLQAHPTRRGIVVSHSILNVASPATFTSPGAVIYNALKANPNFFLMLCGHNSGEARREDTYNGNKVYSLIADYQSRTNGGSGFMRLLQFSPDNNLIRVRTHSPYFGGWETDADSQFDLLYTMEVGGEAFAVLTTFDNLPSGSTITHAWPGLSPSITYEWYVTLNDGTETVTSERRRFTTGANLPPIVSLTAPAPTASYTAPAEITMTAVASDTDGTIAKVEFYQNGALLGEATATPFTFTLSGVAEGVYALTAVAYDNEGGQTTSTAVSVTVNAPNNVPPVVSIASPGAGATYEATATVTIVATASDSDGTITLVEFFQGASKLGEDDSQPYELLWDNVAAGSYTLTAVAHDNRGASTISSGVAIAVVPPPAVVRGPYLQLGTSDSMLVRWRTDLAAGSRVRYGTTDVTLSLQMSDPTLTTEHAVVLADLQPGTRYYYQIGTANGWFARTGHEFFEAAPATGVAAPTRIWVLGDAGGAAAGAAAVRDGYLAYAAAQPAGQCLMLGDNAFPSGTDADYQAAVFSLYPTVLPNTALWPALGEIDTGGSAAPPADLPYFNIFNLPANAEAGGEASGTENYYSFNRANVHFVCLDSMSSGRTTSEAMLTWLQNDLAANTQPWVIAYWHHPPYSKGSHDSDLELESMQMRGHALDILESHGVDLVLSAHSRSYERSFMINGHYGNANTFLQTMKRDGGNGRVDGTGAYQKPPGALGTVYVVAGSSSDTAGGPLNHPAMLVSSPTLGSLVLDVDGDRLDVAFVGTDGTALDHFTIRKPPTPTAPPAAPTELTLNVVSASTIDLAWTHTSTDEQGFKVERSPDGNTFTEILVLGANITSTRDTGLSANTPYHYRVRAYNTASIPDSDYSNVAEATTPSLPAPTGLVATAGDGVVNLTWAEMPSVTQYYVKRSGTSGGPYGTLHYSSGTSYADSSVLNGTTYFYVVTAVLPGGESPPSNEASTTPHPPPPTAPTDLRVTLVSADYIELLWSDNSSDEAGFTIERSLDGSAYEVVTTVDPNTDSFSEGFLKPCTQYYYRVRAYNAWGDSAPAQTSLVTADGEPPTIILSGANPLVVECHGAFTDPGATATDLCSGSLPVTATGSVDVNAVGTYTLTYTATDTNGNTAMATRTVNVVDTTAPVVSCPAGTAVNADANCQAAIPNVLASVTVSDACDSAPTLSQSPAAGTLMGPGTHTITVMATDDTGNQSTGTTTLTVSDSIPPVIAGCPPDQAAPTDAGRCTATVTWTTPAASDACAGAVAVTCSPASGSAFSQGITPVTCTASDAAGNTATCAFNVTVTDREAPVISCPAGTSVAADATCQAAVPNVLGGVTASDNCGGVPTLSQSPVAGTLVGLGVTTITVTATDSAGNSATCATSLTVTDGTPPQVTLTGSATMTVECHTSFADPGATATDACAGNLPVAVSGSVDANTPGSYTLIYSATDPSGNAASATRTVNVVDTTPPVVSCPPGTTVNADANCQAAIPDMLASVTVSDACDSAPTLTQSPVAETLVGPGTHTITVTATDDAGNQSTCTTTLTVVETTPPTITTCATSRTVSAGADGQAPVPDLTTDVVATDNCDTSLTITQEPAPGTLVGLGGHPITLTVKDDAGNQVTCTATVTVVDTTAPTITACAADQTVSAVTGCQAPVPDLTGQVTATDNCTASGALVVTQAPAAGTPADLGVTTVTLTVADAAGNKSTCPTTLTVSDTTPPVIAGRPADQAVSTDAGQCTAAVTWITPTASDACAGAVAVTCSPASGSDFSQGTTPVTCTASDAAGNTATCGFTVTVNDTQNPTITCPVDVVVSTDAGQCAATGVVLGTPVTADNCGVASVANNAPASFPVGETTVTWTVTDTSGKTATCAQKVTVTDTQAPTITCPADVVVNADAGTCAATGVVLGTPLTADNCGVASVANDAPASFPVGVTTVTWTVTDTSAKTASCIQKVTVTDTQAPTITCPANVVVNADAEQCAATGVVLGTPVTADNCGVASVANNAPASFPVGETLVTWTVTDVNGNPATGLQKVTVNETTPPVISCPAGTSVAADTTCQAAVPNVLGGVTASDNCGSTPTLSQSPVAGTLVGLGVKTITVTATDSAGNSATCATTVTVTDGTPPQVTLNGEVTMTVECHTTFTDPGATATDACAGAFAVTGTGAVDANTPGIYILTYSASDPSGNTGTATRTVNVVDTTAPVVTLVGSATMTVECHSTFTDPGATAADACAGSLTTVASGSVNVNAVGSYTLTNTATDPSGKTGTATRTVNVVDTTPPAITGVAATDITATTARITWTTDEPADSMVDYGLDQPYGSQAADLTPTTSHTIDLANLTPGRTYYYQVTSRDASVNSVTSSGHTFATVGETIHNAFASQDPTLTYGTLGGGGFAATFADDDTSQTIIEAGSSARLQAEYLLHTTITPAEVTGLTLYLVATWTAFEASDPLVVSIWNGSAWEIITADIQDGAFTPGTNPQNYVSAEGNIRVRFTDTMAKKNELKDTLAIDLLYARLVAGPPDTQPPAAPTGLNASVADLNVTLSWTANTEPDLAGYRVYRSAGGAYELLTPQLLTATSYVNSTPAAGTYYYVVTAVDRSGNESAGSTPASATTTPPSQSVHVQSITLSIRPVSSSWQATAGVLVHDQSGTGRPGATVYGDWYFKGSVAQSGVSGQTDAAGVATITSPTKRARSGDVFLFRVTNIVLTGYPYDPAQNHASEGSVAVP